MPEARVKVYMSPDEFGLDRADASAHGWSVVSVEPQADGSQRVTYVHGPTETTAPETPSADAPAPAPLVSALPDSTHALDIPGIFLILPEGDLMEGIEAAAAVASRLVGSGYLAGSQGRFVLVPGTSPHDVQEVLATARAALVLRRAPSLVIALFGDLATWDVESANLPKAALKQVREVVAEIDKIRRMVAE